MKGVIFDLKRFAVHDGPGIRTTVFLRGCPLRCAWCHNPESQGFGIDALGGTAVGREVSVDEVLQEVERDVSFFDESGGGVTFSGGEPLCQPEFLLEALERCGEQDIHRTVDTSGYADADVMMSVVEKADLVLFDLKHADAKEHKRWMGVELDSIHDNLRALCETDVAIRLRLPIIPGITDTEANLSAMRDLKESLPRKLPVDLLRYHRAAMDKYPRFGMTPPLPDTPEPTDEEMTQVERMINGDQSDSTDLAS